MTNAERFHRAHAIAKQIRSCFSCYRDAFAFALSEVYAMEAGPKWNAIEGWYFAKSDIANWAFRDDQIIRETEKALLVRLAVKYAGVGGRPRPAFRIKGIRAVYGGAVLLDVAAPRGRAGPGAT